MHQAEAATCNTSRPQLGLSLSTSTSLLYSQDLNIILSKTLLLKGNKIGTVGAYPYRGGGQVSSTWILLPPKDNSASCSAVSSRRFIFKFKLPHSFVNKTVLAIVRSESKNVKNL